MIRQPASLISVGPRLYHCDAALPRQEMVEARYTFEALATRLAILEEMGSTEGGVLSTSLNEKAETCRIAVLTGEISRAKICRNISDSAVSYKRRGVRREFLGG